MEDAFRGFDGLFHAWFALRRDAVFSAYLEQAGARCRPTALERVTSLVASGRMVRERRGEWRWTVMSDLRVLVRVLKRRGTRRHEIKETTIRKVRLAVQDKSFCVRLCSYIYHAK